jgi:predicted secreted hydrolase
MNARVFLLLLWPITTSAQGFAGLGTDVDGFSSPQRPAQFDFPIDHGPHYDYRIEWWYLTANLEGLDGTPYGLQWTLFRSALTSDGGKGWSSPQLWMGHAAVTTPDAHFVTERLARGGIGQAGVQADPFEAWIDDWQLVGPDLATLTMTASGPEFAYDMVLNLDGPLVFHGDEGYSVKSAEGQASFYYSQPFYAIEGTLILPTGSIEVAGDAWLDREWSSQPLSDNQTGWDWFSLSLEDGKLMGFRLRQTDGSYYTSATWIDPNGTTTSYSNSAFEADPVAISDVGGRDVPTTWNVRLPDRGVDVEVTAINPQAWMDTSVPYWEGPIIVQGSHTGRGYLEMTGYD